MAYRLITKLWCDVQDKCPDQAEQKREPRNATANTPNAMEKKEKAVLDDGRQV
jgi:hypothetical protein